MKLKTQITFGIIFVCVAVLLPILLIPISRENLIEFETLPNFGYSPVEKRDFYVVNSNEEFLNFWNITHYSNPEPPSIDFTDTTVIAVYGGIHGTGASLEITKIKLQNNITLVYYKIERYVTAVISYPCHIVKTQKLDSEFEFIEI